MAKGATQILLILLEDEPEVAALVQAVLKCVDDEKAAKTIMDHVKAAEPAAELAAGLADKLKGQLGGPTPTS